MNLDNFEIIDKIELYKNSNLYYALYRNKTYEIGRILFDVIENKKHTEDSYIDFLKKKKYSDEEITVILEKIELFFENIKKENNNKSYISFKILLLNKEQTIKISSILKCFFKRKYFLVIFLLLSLVNFVFILVNLEKIYRFIDLSFSSLVFFYTSIFIILIFHELGHSSASLYHKVNPNEIGFGFYFIFPVLYSNVSKIWILEKEKRIIVNLGGIYFQLIFNAILILLFYLIENLEFQKIILVVIRVNVFILLYSLIPFIRNDGYWIVSDFLEIPNLNKKSNAFFVNLIKRILNKPVSKKTIIRNSYKWVVVYSILNHLFLFFIVLSILTYIYNISNKLIQIYLSNEKKMFLYHIELNLFSIIISLIIIILFIKTFVNWIKTHFVYKKI